MAQERAGLARLRRPAAFYTDHGSDFTSARWLTVEKNRLVPAHPARLAPRGAAPDGTRISTADLAEQAALSLAELDAAIGRFIVGEYAQQPHGETGQPPQARWDAGGFLLHLPDSLEQPCIPFLPGRLPSAPQARAM